MVEALEKKQLLPLRFNGYQELLACKKEVRAEEIRGRKGEVF
jgi:hypothetical protein